MADEHPYLIEQETAPIMMTPGLRFAGGGTTSDGKMWLKFINTGGGRLRVVHIIVLATSFTYHYAMRDPSTGTIEAYEGPYGDPEKDTSFLYGTD
jgi:hypothetical protein